MPLETKSDSIERPIVGRAGVLLPLPLEEPFDYAAPADMALSEGDFVRVALGKRELVGVVWGRGTAPIETSRLRPIAERMDLPALPRVSRSFIEWVAAYYLAPLGSVLRMAMSVRDAFKPDRSIAAYLVAEPDSGRLTAARRRVIDNASREVPMTGGDLARLAGVGGAVIRQMATIGQLREIAVPAPLPFGDPDPDHARPSLSPTQERASEILVEAVKRDARGGVTLLDGVTGSGKTEVYFEAVAAALERGKQALVLLPEIALTHQWLARFEARFGARPAQWHSDLTALERKRTWRAVLENRAKVIVGARSALFLPFRDLGLIVVDEEHESAFKQEDGVVYHARDMAVVRGHLARMPVVLSSATPSLETMQNVVTGKYAHLHLPERHAGAPMPSVELVDLRRGKPARGGWLSPDLLVAIRETLARSEQVLLFLNRRGYAPLTLCRHCGHRWQCPNCTAWLVEHRYIGKLQCHHCGHQVPVPKVCPACAAEGELAACGPGVERLNEEVAATFPEARRLILTSDTAGSPAKAASMFRQIEDRAVDIVIGTQIVAKGHHFPALTLVGVVDADIGLSGGDLRAAERTFQLLHQVAGRAGRAERPGRVLIQTYDPARPVMLALASGDRDQFLALEAADRRLAGMPPFGRLAAIILSGSDGVAIDKLAQALARTAPRQEGVVILGPAPAPLALLKGRHRRRFLLKCRREIAPQSMIRRWLAEVKTRGDQAIEVDIDPNSFL